MPPPNRRSSAARSSTGTRYSVHQSPGIVRSPRHGAETKRLKDLCLDLKPILGIEPSPVFFTDERAHSFEKFKDAFQELQFFYGAIVRVVLGKTERLFQHEENLSHASERIDDPSGASWPVYHGIKLYRLTCNALFALKVKPTPSFLEYGDPPASFLQRVAEALIEWHSVLEHSRKEEMRVNAANHRIKAELLDKRHRLDALVKKREEYIQGDTNIVKEERQLEDEKTSLRDSIADTYKQLQKKNSEVQDHEKFIKDAQDLLSGLEHRSLEIQSQVETLRSNVVKSPGRCIKELESYRNRVEQEQQHLSEENKELHELQPLIECCGYASTKLQTAVLGLDRYKELRSGIEDLDRRKNDLEQQYAKKESECKELSNACCEGGLRNKEQFQTIDDEIENLKTQRAQLHKEHETLSRQYEEGMRSMQANQTNLAAKQKELQYRQKLYESMVVSNKKEMQQANELIESQVIEIESLCDDLRSKFSQRFEFHTMDWEDFKTKVQTCFASTEVSEESRDDEDPSIENVVPGARKSVDNGMSQHATRSRRRSSVMAEQVCQALIDNSGPDDEMSALAKTMSPEDRTDYAKRLVLERIDMILGGIGLSSTELAYRDQLPEAIVKTLEVTRDQLKKECH